MQTIERALYVIERTHEIGRMTGSVLAQAPGWNRVLAHRYLTTLSRLGWLERINSRGYPSYVLGKKFLDLIPDLQFR